MGIGRPSTYAPTISTIQKRGYVLKESREGHDRDYRELTLNQSGINRVVNTEVAGSEKNKLFPTNIAMVVNDFLVQHFPNVIDFSFTARVEKEFDDIASGRKEWDSMIDSFYGKFHPQVEDTEKVDRSEVPSQRELGKDPASGKPIIARLGKFGPLVQIGDAEDEEKKFASMRKGQLIESITLEEDLELFKLPRDIGEFEDKVMVAAVGRFGPYIRHDGKFVSIPKGEDPLSISADRAVELIEAKRKADAEKFIKSFDENPEVQILNGRWGPYIKVGKKNVKIPKDKEPLELTLAECLELAEKTPEKKGRGRSTRKKKE